MKKKALFEIVSNKAINYGGGGSRTPVLTVHPSTSTGLDPADESRFPAAVGQSPRGTQGEGVSTAYIRQL